MRQISTLILLLLLAMEAIPQEIALLQEVEVDRAKRLEEYNSVFLRQQTYFASRYRIVQADVSALLQAREITITPFDDVEPIVFILENLERNDEDIIFWKGRYEKDPVYERTGVAVVPATISLNAWDLEPSGTAVISALNRFVHSPKWRLDESEKPVLEALPGQAGSIANTPPPRTPEEIALHKRLLSLEKHAFFSVSAAFDLPDRESTYTLEPLKYTPRYSVVYEIPRSTVIPIRRDRMPGEPEFRNDAERGIFERYRGAMDALPKEENKEIRGDIE